MISEQKKEYFRTRYKNDPIYRSNQRMRAKKYWQETRDDPSAYARRLKRYRELYKLRVKKLKQIKICLFCKEEFRTRYAAKLTCSKKCKYKRTQYRQKLYYQKHKERIKKRVREYTRLYGHG